ncbi:heme o synthase [soil metagenome]
MLRRTFDHLLPRLFPRTALAGPPIPTDWSLVRLPDTAAHRAPTSSIPAPPRTPASFDTLTRTTPAIPPLDAELKPARRSQVEHLGFRAFVELSKPRITRLVVLTAAVGFVLAMVDFGGATPATTTPVLSALDRILPFLPAQRGPLLLAALGCLIGTALSASGANSLNQFWESDRDARMPRTARRPIPTGRLRPTQALSAGIAFSLIGVAILAFTAGLAAALVSALTIAVYVLLYTPMKPVTPLSTLVGAIPGALPPLIGWCAARYAADPAATFAPLTEAGGWSLFALMFVWQIPHFLAIAWMYRDDYARGGFRMLPIFDRTGHLTSLMVAAWAVLLIPATVAPALAMPDRLGIVYVSIATITGLIFLAGTVRLMFERTRARARAVFIGSIIHLPILLLAMMAEVGIRALLR